MENKAFVFTVLTALLVLMSAGGSSAASCKIKPLRGTFLQLDGANLSWTDAQWEQEIRAMKKLGMDTLIICATAQDTYAFCRLSEYPLWAKCGTDDPLQALLDLSQKHGIKVYVGLYAWGWEKQGTADFAEFARRCIVISDEVWHRYGKHPAFVGWYVLNWEMGNVPDENNVAVKAYRRVVPHLRCLSPKMPIITAPYFTIDCDPATFESGWRKLLPLLDVDILSMQDGVGCGRNLTPENVKPYFEGMMRACKDSGVEFWADVEIFDSVPEWKPAQVERVVRQMESVSPYVEKIVVFEFNHYYSPVRCGPEGMQALSKALKR